jgi:hypothetical protein
LHLILISRTFLLLPGFPIYSNFKQQTMTIEKTWLLAGDSLRLVAALKEQFKGNLLVEGDANYEK